MKDKKDISILRSSTAEYLTFVATRGDDETSTQMRYEDENIWLTQKMLAALYDVEVSTINEHIKKIYADNELSKDATIRKFRIVQTEGSREVTREVNREGRLNGFLGLMNREILQDAGRVSMELAKKHAISEFDKYRIIQDEKYLSDYDRFLLELEGQDNE